MSNTLHTCVMSTLDDGVEAPVVSGVLAGVLVSLALFVCRGMGVLVLLRDCDLEGESLF